MNKNVDHPPHYNSGGIEVIDAIEAWGWGEGFNRGNAIKYIARAGRKDPETEIEDLEKACWYLRREIDRLNRAKLRLVICPHCEEDIEVSPEYIPARGAYLFRCPICGAYTDIGKEDLQDT